jgi:hypothetical protein
VRYSNWQTTPVLQFLDSTFWLICECGWSSQVQLEKFLKTAPELL